MVAAIRQIQTRQTQANLTLFRLILRNPVFGYKLIFRH